jgi:ubiquinone/menaquinone biosynthesis C-methylase UbiE
MYEIQAEHETDFYRRFGRWYDQLFEPWVARSGVRERIVRVCPPRAGQRVLDIGAGTGTQLAAYQQAGALVHGIDASPTMLALSRARLGESARLDLGDAAQLPYAGKTFDLVLVTYVLHEIPRAAHAQVIAECQRVLKDEGRIVIVDFDGVPAFPGRGFSQASILLAKMLMGPYGHFRDYVKHGGLSELVARSPLHVYHDFTGQADHTAMAVLGRRAHWQGLVTDFQEGSLRDAMPVPETLEGASRRQA